MLFYRVVFCKDEREDLVGAVDLRTVQEQDDGDENIGRRQDAEGAANVEVGDIRGSGLLSLRQKQERDEISGDDKEDFDSETGKAIQRQADEVCVVEVQLMAGMTDQDEDDREGSQAIQ